MKSKSISSKLFTTPLILTGLLYGIDKLSGYLVKGVPRSSRSTLSLRLGSSTDLILTDLILYVPLFLQFQPLNYV
jgi:hypothetical protein